MAAMDVMALITQDRLGKSLAGAVRVHPKCILGTRVLRKNSASGSAAMRDLTPRPSRASPGTNPPERTDVKTYQEEGAALPAWIEAVEEAGHSGHLVTLTKSVIGLNARMDQLEPVLDILRADLGDAKEVRGFDSKRLFDLHLKVDLIGKRISAMQNDVLRVKADLHDLKGGMKDHFKTIETTIDDVYRLVTQVAHHAELENHVDNN